MASGTVSMINMLARLALSDPSYLITLHLINQNLNLFWKPCFCTLLLDRSLKMTSGRHMGGPQGAEVITPVPLRGWFWLIGLVWDLQEQWFSVFVRFFCSVFVFLHLFITVGEAFLLSTCPSFFKPADFLYYLSMLTQEQNMCSKISVFTRIFLFSFVSLYLY